MQKRFKPSETAEHIKVLGKCFPYDVCLKIDLAKVKNKQEFELLKNSWNKLSNHEAIDFILFKIYCISVITHSSVILATISLSKILSPK